MTQKGAVEIKVGIAVGIALVLFIITVFMLGGDQSIFSSTYTLRIPFESVDGLVPGSVVRLNGFQVGNIADIKLSEKDDKIVVFAKILKKFQNKITVKSIADVKTQGALGDKYVAIDPGEPGAEPLKDGDLLPVKEGKDLLTTLTQRGDEIGRIFDILNELHQFTKALNKDNRADQMMGNLTSASKHMDQAMSEFQLAVRDLRGDDGKNLKKISYHIESVFEKLDNGNGTLGELINDPTIHDKLKSFLGGSKRNDYMKSLIQKTIEEGKK
jgi:phospholipid/cholesterol/gamma-HCH transport system substrate-binding protein